jgi:hypothetical protein
VARKAVGGQQRPDFLFKKLDVVGRNRFGLGRFGGGTFLGVGRKYDGNMGRDETNRQQRASCVRNP